jgi:hypothetical protein
MSTTQTTAEREGILVETAAVKLMTRCVLYNGGEPNYATEKLMRAFHSIVRALIRHLHVNPRDLNEEIEREIVR